MTATGCERAALERCREIAGGSVFGPIGVASRTGNARPAWRWCLKGTALGPLLESLMPFLTIKREHAQILLVMRQGTSRGARSGEFGRRRSEAEFAQRARMKLAINALNHRGSTLIPPDRLEALAAVRAELAIATDIRLGHRAPQRVAEQPEDQAVLDLFGASS